MPRRRDVVHQARITWPGSRVASSPMDDPKTFFPLPICIQVYTYISELGCMRVTRSSCQGASQEATRKRGLSCHVSFFEKIPPNISPPLVRLDSYCGMTPLSHEKLSDLTYSPPWRMGTDRRHGPKDIIDGITYASVRRRDSALAGLACGTNQTSRGHGTYSNGWHLPVHPGCQV